MGKKQNNDEKSSADTIMTAESAQMCEKEGVSEVKRDVKRDKEEKRKKKKKKKKKKKNEEVEDLKNDSRAFGDNGEMEMKKREKKKNKSDTFEIQEVSGKEVVEEKKMKKKKKVKISNIEGEKDGEVSREIRKKRKMDDNNEAKPDEVDLSSVEQQQEKVEDHTQATKQDVDAMTMTNHERKKKKLKHKRKDKFKDDLAVAQQEFVAYDTNSLLNAYETQKSEAEHTKKRKKENTKKRNTSLVVNRSDDTSPNKSNKKVRFSGSNTEKGNVKEENMVRGKRFTPEEDEIVKAAVMEYIEERELGDKGIDMVINSKKHPGMRGCWKEIGSSIPYRPQVSVYWRARVLFLRSENRKWTQEEKDLILKYQAEHGNHWRALADELGKHIRHVTDTWRQIKLRNLKKGRWSQDEYQKLFDLVNTDLQLKVSEDKISKHGMLRDNISWTAISDVLSTRDHTAACKKWYKQLTSAMVVEGVWADTDDYRLVGALYSLDATCMEDVDWDNIIETRSGEVCRRRWNQMVRYIGHNGKKSFAEQVEVLAERYCPYLLKARQTWDNKPRVP